ncbi:MAG: hypothetical protein OXN44_12660 [Acidimicrobiaceae bacterium]|nr:hypothetical protein [Acidimicrobiaceae bacterium]
MISIAGFGIRDPDPPDVDDAERVMLAVAGGETDEQDLAEWLRERAAFIS